MDNLTIAEQIRIIAKRKNISLSEVAERIGKSPANFLNQLKADNFRINDLKKIAVALGVSFSAQFIEK